MKVHVNAQVKKINRSGNLRVTFLQNGEEKEVEGDYVLVATGRMPQVENLKVENLGLKMENRGVWTDEFLRTSILHLLPWGCKR
jgi:dihydrolipoamide dehydrogenase